MIREFALLGDVLDAAVRRVAGPAASASAEHARTTIQQLLAQTERVSLRGFRLSASSAKSR